MNLLSLQRTMARAVMQPLTPSEHMSGTSPAGGSMSAYAEKFIKPNDRLTSFDRLEIYNRQYWFRLMSGLAEDFPGLQAILGSRRFDALCKQYLTDCPSRSFTLRNLGKNLEAWLKKNPKWAGQKQAIALDMVRLEWADIEAFDAAAEDRLRTAEVARAGAGNVRLRLQPFVQLLHLRYPVDNLVLEIKRFNDDTEFLSNAFREKRKRRRVQKVAKLQPNDIYMVVHRADNSVYFRRLQPAEFRILIGIRNGESLESAVVGAFGHRSQVSTKDLEKVTRWFSNWARLGWFCKLHKKKSTG
jgi:hypothetical protein